MQINLEFDALALAAPQPFRDAVRQAADIIDSTFTDQITVNISVGYGELTTPDGQTDTLPSHSAEAETWSGDFFRYSTVRNSLLNSVDPAVLSGAQALPATSTLQGHSYIEVWSGIEKALGLISPTDSALDGAVGFATDIPQSNLVGVALHELTHAMGRASGASASYPTVFDLYRYTGSGTHLFGSTIPGQASYFSLNGGASDLVDYGVGSDPSDYLNNGKAPYDPFEERYVSGTYQYLTALDIKQMQALGFHTAPVLPSFSAGPNLYWENSAGMTALWELNGANPATGVALPGAPGWQINDVGDFNGDGLAADLVLRNTTTGLVELWLDDNGHMAGHDVDQATLDWQIMGAADFNADGKSDLLWRNEQNGYVSVWQMDGSHVATTYNPGVVGLQWHVVGAGDYAGDGKAEVLWRDSGTGEVNLWTIDGPGAGQTHGQTVAVIPLQWTVIGGGDFNGDGKQDILWRDSTNGQVVEWQMDGARVASTAAQSGLFPATPTEDPLGLQWHVAGVVDINGDGKDDVMWRDVDSGQVIAWQSTGSSFVDLGPIGTVDATWQPINHHFDWV